jgi:hypothetical protein
MAMDLKDAKALLDQLNWMTLPAPLGLVLGRYR